jgi:hypothetical protein
MKTVLPLLVTLTLSRAAPRKVPFVPDVVFPPVPENGKTFSNLNITVVTTCRHLTGGHSFHALLHSLLHQTSSCAFAKLQKATI